MAKFLIIGKGKMGSLIGAYLSRKHSVKYVDLHKSTGADYVMYNLDESNGMGYFYDDLLEIIKTEAPNVIIGSASYKLNYELSVLACATSTPFIDLGGNVDVVKQQKTLNQTIDSPPTIIPDCGLAPGLAHWVANHFSDEKTTEISIYVGGIPQKEYTYACEFSIEGLINEYIEPCEIKKDGEIEIVPGLSGHINLDYLEEYPYTKEAFYTSGGLGSLCHTSHVPNISYRTIRWNGHHKFIDELNDAGFFKPENRKHTEKILQKYYSNQGPDQVIVQIEVSGPEYLFRYSLTDKHDGVNTAMARCTGYPAAIVAEMIAEGKIPANLGVVNGEEVIPVAELLDILELEGIVFEKIDES